MFVCFNNLSRSKIYLFLKMTNMSLLLVFSDVHFVKLCEVLFLLYTLEYYQFIFSTYCRKQCAIFLDNPKFWEGKRFRVLFFLLMNCHTVIVHLGIWKKNVITQTSLHQISSDAHSVKKKQIACKDKFPDKFFLSFQ